MVPFELSDLIVVTLLVIFALVAGVLLGVHMNFPDSPALRKAREIENETRKQFQQWGGR